MKLSRPPSRSTGSKAQYRWILMYIYHEYVLGAALGHNKKGCHGAGGGGGRSGVVVVVGVGGGMRVVVHIH